MSVYIINVVVTMRDGSKCKLVFDVCGNYTINQAKGIATEAARKQMDAIASTDPSIIAVGYLPLLGHVEHD